MNCSAKIGLASLFFIFTACTTVPTTNPELTDSEMTAGLRKPDSFHHEVSHLIGSFKVDRYEFTNGLRLLVVEDHSSPTFAYQTWFRVGSRNEKVGYTGLAHLFEHLMFKGTKSLKEGEFDKILEGAGVQGENAFTSRDYTAYIQELPSSPEKLELIAKLESDRMVNLIVDQKSFKTEREVVQNERRYRNENSPDGLMDQELFSLAFTRHPYHWPVIGYQKDLDRMSDKNAFNFYKSYYSPNHATVVVVGDVNPTQVAATVQKYYGALSAQPEIPERIKMEPIQGAPRTKTLKLNIQVEKLMIGYRVPAFEHEDAPVINVLQSVLASGKSSRLYQALVESGIATGVDCSEIDDKDPSLMVIVANLQKQKKASKAEEVVYRELKRLQNELVSEQELERARNKMTFDFYEELNSNFDKARFIGQFETITHHFSSGIDHFKKTQLVTAKDLQRVAKKYFVPRSRTVIQGVPK